jgi:hypothetical protein
MHACSVCTPGFPQENDGALPWQGLEDEWRTDCPTDAVPGWVFDAARWYRLWEKDKDPIALGRAEWLPFAFVEVVQEFGSAEAEERAKRGKGG